METKDFKKTKGITLISLVVSIVVLLILAGIAIVTLTGENSIINQATKAKETTAKSEFLERAKLAYSDIFIEETADLKTPAITLAKIKKKLNEEQPGSVKGTGTYEITGVKYNGQEVTETLKVPDDGEITLQVDTDTVSEDSKFYGFIQGRYYEILLENSEITLGEEKTLAEIEAGTSVSELTVVLEKESGATTNVDILVDQNQKEVTIKGKGVNTGRGAGIIKISYGNTKNIGIDVVETFTVTVQAEQENNVAKGTITSPSVATQKYASGSKLILQATANEGLKLKDWYDGTSAIGTTNSYEYIVNGNKTITARFEYKFALGSEVTIGDEHFYVIKKYTENSVDKVTLISKYNLATEADETTGKYYQQNADYSTTAFRFSNSNYWLADWKAASGTARRINLNTWDAPANKTMPAEEDLSNNALLRARKYGQDLGGIGRLLTYDEANTGDSTNGLFKTSAMQTILYGKYTGDDKVGGSSGDGFLFFWLASSYEGSEMSIKRVFGGNGTISEAFYNYSSKIGVRPVIEIDESTIE